MNKIKKFKATFENGGFWEFYKDLEKQFEGFLEYVPYVNGNEGTYSFKLLSLILSIGGYIDSAFKEMARFSEFSEDELCKKILKRAKEKLGIIKSGVEAFDENYGISTKVVTFKFIPKRDYIKPFEFTEHKPEWWGFYTELKHDVGVNLEKANLRNTRDALAAAFLLNTLHTPSVLRLLDYGLMKNKISHREVTPSPRNREVIENMLRKREKINSFIETPVFVYDYEQ